jgi:hypothetical protein
MSAGQVDPGQHIARVGDLRHAIELLELIKSRAIEGKAVVYPHRPADEILTVSSWTADDERNYLQLPSSQGK